MIALHASVSPGEMRVAAWDGDVLHDVAIWRESAPDGVGDLYRGRVVSRVKAMAGAFVAIDGAEGFLPDSEGAADEGTVLGVRITRAAQGGKGPRLTARLSPGEQALAGTGAPALLRRGPDALSRLAALYPLSPILIDDAGTAARLRLNAELVANAFPPELEDAWEALASPTAELPGGARMHVHPTLALVAIDVDLGAATAARQSKSHAQAQANRALLPELARQIRLRNLSGAILVDLGGMALKRRAAMAPDFARALATDPLAPRFLGFTALGLAEILRPRVHPPLHELLAGPHATGLAGLRALCRAAAAAPHRAFQLRAAPDVAQALRRDVAAQEAVAARTGRKLRIVEERAWLGRCEMEESDGSDS
jgi:ribonuclease G